VESPLRAVLESRGISVHSVPFQRLNQSGAAMPLRWLRAAMRVAEVARLEKVDILHSNTARAHLVGSLAAGLSRKPLVWTLHDNSLPLRIARILSPAPARAIAVSDWLKQHYAPAGLRRKLVEIPNGLEPAPVTGQAAGELRTELGVPPDAPFVINVGRLVAGKAPHVFVEAARMVAAAVPGAFFALVGAPDAVEAGQPAATYAGDVLAKALTHSELGKHMLLTGHRADVARFFAAADVAVYSSVLPEGLPTVLLEAMQASRPVVATAIGGALEIVVDGVTGRLVPTSNPGAMAAGILECLNDPARARSWGQSGRARLEQSFSLKGQARQTEAVYRSVLAGAAGGAP
jgi:glycosyltransferase involved in cell wall biosynthesis